jgi:hypothetical protein
MGIQTFAAINLVILIRSFERLDFDRFPLFELPLVSSVLPPNVSIVSESSRPAFQLPETERNDFSSLPTADCLGLVPLLSILEFL